MILLISASQVVRITDFCHHTPAELKSFKLIPMPLSPKKKKKKRKEAKRTKITLTYEWGAYVLF
jgi:hypothetical protein